MLPSMLAGRRQVAPLAFGKAVDRLEEDRAVRQHRRARGGRRIERPLQARVADVDGEKAHDRTRRGGWPRCWQGEASRMVEGRS
jgi:hypothetical protein